MTEQIVVVYAYLCVIFLVYCIVLFDELAEYFFDEFFHKSTRDKQLLIGVNLLLRRGKKM